MSYKKIVIIGATSLIAEHCARLWAAQNPDELILVGRDLLKMDLVANDLRVRSPSTLIKCQEVDFESAEKIQLLAESLSKGESIDLVLIAHGFLPDQSVCQRDLNIVHEALEVNGISPVLFAEAFAGCMATINHGVLAIISSVAGDRGRKSNYVYGAAKGLVSLYAQGLQHRFSNTKVTVVLIKPGPTDTPMTAMLRKKNAKLAPVELVAKSIVSGIKKGSATVYAPAHWAFIMMIIRHLPSVIFNKLNI